MMKTKLLALLCVGAISFAPLAFADPANGDLLTGDVRLACEATLCLSSGKRPEECAPSLKRYFSIHHKKIQDTIKARRNFLKLCPTDGDDKKQNQDMDRFVDILANGAGRCDAAELNRVMKRSYQEQVCSKGYQRRDEPICNYVTKFYISKDKPSYCTTYFDHEWTTAGEKVRFVGKEKQGGKWVDIP